MRNQSLIYPGHFTQTNMLTGQIHSDYDVPNQDYDLFSYEGFGPPVGRKFVDASPGSYDRQVYISTKGYVDSKELRLGTGELLGYLRQEGAMGVVGAPTRLSYTNYPIDYSSEVYNQALEKLYEGLKLSEQNLALTLGEFRESGRMLGVGKSVFALLATARTVKRQFLRNPSKTMSELWLGAQLGWKPLLNDIHGYLNWTYTAFNEGVPVLGRRNKTEQVNDRNGEVQTSPGLSVVSGHKQRKAEIKLWAGLADSSTYNLTRITSLNPLSIVWELVPLSFVVDWLYDIGGYLQLMESALGAGMTFKRGYATEVYYHDLNEKVIMHTQEISGLSIFDNYRSYDAKWRHARKRRVKLTGFPFPRAPTFKLSLGSGQIITSAALLRVILLGKVR